MTVGENGSDGRDATTCKARLLLLPRAPTIRRNDATEEERNGMISMVYSL